MKIVKAKREDAGALSELTMRSKDHWNYGATQMEKWRDGECGRATCLRRLPVANRGALGTQAA